jgi:hypothetical protein
MKNWIGKEVAVNKSPETKSKGKAKYKNICNKSVLRKGRSNKR